ncbi:MAG TPA: ABC transporter permease subunit [Candidatus Cybelea sp.]|nr:ABC transporter permease subunit [Candidatus Cybelea sp.]
MTAPERYPMSLGRNGARIVAYIPYIWLLALFLAPFLIVLKISFAGVVLAQPPYTPLFDLGGGTVRLLGSFDNYFALIDDSLYIRAYAGSLRIAFESTLIALGLALPMAYGLSRAPLTVRPLLVAAAVLPFWTSFLIRVYAWIGILKPEGWLNAGLSLLGFGEHRLAILDTEAAVVIGMVYSYLPFMLLPLYASLEKLDFTLLEAAADLGCRPARAFWSVTFPLALPGVIAGCLLMFIPAVGEFVIPDLLGGSSTLMIGKTLWVEFFVNRDWPLASAATVVLVLLLMVPLAAIQRRQSRLLRGLE